MDRLKHKSLNKELRKNRVRARVSGTAERPRLSVHISNRHITAQIINDHDKRTLAYASTIGTKVDKQSLTELAKKVGEEIAAKAKSHKIETVVLDRGSRLYHGRIKALADAAREKGLNF